MIPVASGSIDACEHPPQSSSYAEISGLRVRLSH
jgi:hypothetical protein